MFITGKNWFDRIALAPPDAGAGGEASDAPPADSAVEGESPADGGEGGPPDAGDQAQGNTLLTGGGEESTGSEDGQTEDGGGSETDAPAEAFALEVADGFENFKDEFAAFEGSAKGYLEENPKASAADALKWAANQQAEAVKEITDQAEKEFKDQVDTWRKELQSDPEIGGDKLGENLGIALKAVQAIGGEPLVEALEMTGAGNHPAIVRAFHVMGKLAVDNPEILGGETAPDHADVALRARYPSEFKGA